MLSNAYFLAKFRFDAAEIEPAKSLQNLPILLTLRPRRRREGRAVPGPTAGVGRGVEREGRLGADEAAGLGRLRGRRYQFLAKFRQDVARFRLYRHRFLQENTRFTAFFKIYQIFKLKILRLQRCKSMQIL